MTHLPGTSILPDGKHFKTLFFIQKSIYVFNKYLLSIGCMPVTVLSTVLILE